MRVQQQQEQQQSSGKGTSWVKVAAAGAAAAGAAAAGWSMWSDNAAASRAQALAEESSRAAVPRTSPRAQVIACLLPVAVLGDSDDYEVCN